MAAKKRTTTDFRAAEFAAETKPQIEPEEPELIENFLAMNGPCRRASTVLLSKTWSTTAKLVIADRAFAVACGAVFHALEESLGNYLTLAALLESAHERLGAALYQRGDVDAILAEAAQDEVH